MEYSIEYLSDINIVNVKIKGKLNFSFVANYSKKAILVARKNNCLRFLFDHTETSTKEGSEQIYTRGDEMEQFGFKSTDRIAILVKDIWDDRNQISNQNIKWSATKYFPQTNYDESINWLLGQT